ncbi:XrtB/PEP-CTERM-associated transcriptional regulator EpsA [Mangrovimicrobium sediminis]|nr:XrtB/PEP-CTERM-associated transcriptional regulator EpsA [Haliea sp. SAOS-164]
MQNWRREAPQSPPGQRFQERLIATLGAATSIRSHQDFYRWLQNDITPFIPHHTLMAAWGDFSTRSVSYDIASVINGVNTRAVQELDSVERGLQRLRRALTESEQNWLLLKEFDSRSAEWADISQSFPAFGKLMLETEKVLTYLLRDEREGLDCLYIFNIQDRDWRPDESILDLLMPQLDSALRRVKCLPQNGDAVERSPEAWAGLLSSREIEVINWVSQGKSNEEIGTILGISRNTVKNHLKRIFNKMGVTARSQAVRVFMQGGVSYP